MKLFLKIYFLACLLVVYFGFILPYLVSAKSTITVMLAVISFPIVIFLTRKIFNSEPKTKDKK